MMHQGPKSTKPLTEQELSKKEKLGKEIDEMLQKFIKLRHASSPQDVGIKDAFQFTTIMSQMCPDLYTIYNYRKELIEEKYKETEEQEIYQFVDKELQFLNGLLKKTPKSYCIWHHRKSMILKACKLEEKLNIPFEQSIINKELFLCSKMLEKDERNFHAWNYRNWIVHVDPKVKYEIIKKEIDYTKNKIAVNFTNFSALHFRQKHLINYYQYYLTQSENEDELNNIFQFQIPLKLINEEFEMLKTGLYMQPNEQGIWQHHNWLLELLQPIKILSVQAVKPVQKNSINLIICFSEKIANFSSENIQIKGIKDQKEITELFSIDIQQHKKNQKYSNFYFIEISSPENSFEQQQHCEIQLIIENSHKLKSNFTNLNNKKFFIEANYLINYDSLENQSPQISIKYQNTNEKIQQQQNEIQEIINRELKIVNEILELEPENKFVLMEKNWIFQKKLNTLLFQQSTNDNDHQIENLFQELIENYKKLINFYPKQEVMFTQFLDFYSLKNKIWNCLINNNSADFPIENWKKFEQKFVDLDDCKILILAKNNTEEYQQYLQDIFLQK